MATLHVFIDESGQHHRGDHYTLAACWAVSEHDNNNTSRVLDPTKQKILASVDKRMTEIKGTRLAQDTHRQLVSNLESFTYSDSTVMNNPSTWDNSTAIRATFHDVNPDLAVSSLQNLFGEGRASKNSIHLLALVAVLNPVFSERVQSTPEIDNIRVSLDGGIWKQASTAFEKGLTPAGYSGLPISVAIEDSKHIPGIQLADLIAYPWRQYQLTGEHAASAALLRKLQFTSR